METEKKIKIRQLLEKLYKNYTLEELELLRQLLDTCTLENLRDYWLFP